MGRAPGPRALLVTLVLVAVGIGGLAGAGTLVGDPMPVQGPTPDFGG